MSDGSRSSNQHRAANHLNSRYKGQWESSYSKSSPNHGPERLWTFQMWTETVHQTSQSYVSCEWVRWRVHRESLSQAAAPTRQTHTKWPLASATRHVCCPPYILWRWDMAQAERNEIKDQKCVSLHWIFNKKKTAFFLVWLYTILESDQPHTI